MGISYYGYDNDIKELRRLKKELSGNPEDKELKKEYNSLIRKINRKQSNALRSYSSL